MSIFEGQYSLDHQATWRKERRKENLIIAASTYCLSLEVVSGNLVTSRNIPMDHGLFL